MVERDDFETMQQQIAMLRKKLESQQIINDEFMRRTMRGTIKRVNNALRWELALGIFALFFCPVTFVKLGDFSTPFIIYIVLMLAYSLIFHIYTMYIMPSLSNPQNEISQFLTRLVRFETLRRRGLFAGIVLSLIFLAWFAVEILQTMPREAAIAMTICGIIGGIIGGVMGIKVYLNVAHCVSELREDADLLKG